MYGHQTKARLIHRSVNTNPNIHRSRKALTIAIEKEGLSMAGISNRPCTRHAKTHVETIDKLIQGGGVACEILRGWCRHFSWWIVLRNVMNERTREAKQIYNGTKETEI